MRVLIIGMSLNVGGAEKSLVNFLNMIKHDEYETDLLLFQKKGAFINQIPSEINILCEREIRVLFQTSIETLKMKGKRLKDFKLMLLRYFITYIERKRWKQFDQIRLHRWLDYYSKYIPELKREYDLAIAFAGGETAYYMVDKVKANRKVYFFHSDYSEIEIDADLERKYVDRVNSIITISDVCKKSLDSLFPEKKDDIKVLNNLSSATLIWKLAKDYNPKEFQVTTGVIRLVSVGRLNSIKGFDMAVEAAGILRRQGIRFRWVVVGEGEERQKLEKLIKENEVKENFILVGMKENPYPYILNADILVQTSRFEGKSVVLDEAKILGKPAIITNYNSAHDQVKDGFDGLIVEMYSQNIADGVIRCVSNPHMLEKMSENIIVKKDIENIEGYMSVLRGE